MTEIHFVLNGRSVSYSGSLTDRLLDVLREQFRCTSVKCGCKEGECGACSVLLDGVLYNSCCVAMGAVEGRSVVTMEGFRKTERFQVLERSFGALSAVQCGFCIPGMVLAAEALLSKTPHPTEEEVREGLSGNLCRCTGYNAIVKAVLQAAEDGAGLWDPEDAALTSQAPASLAEALSLRKNTTLIPYAGGTDLMVENRPGANYLFLHRVPELRVITEDEQFIRIGAAVTFTEAIEHPLVPELMKEALRRIAAPAIRNAGTFGGNLGNGSAKADSVLIAFVADAKLRLLSQDGERIVPVEDFYLGRKKLDLHPDELIAELLLPKTGLERYYYQKVGDRNALAISRVSFAGVFAEENGRITNVAAAFGAVAGTVLRYKDLESRLIGRTLEEAREVKADYLRAYADRMVLTRGRVSAEYRKAVCMNLLDDFLRTFGI